MHRVPTKGWGALRVGVGVGVSHLTRCFQCFGWDVVFFPKQVGWEFLERLGLVVGWRLKGDGCSFISNAGLI